MALFNFMKQFAEKVEMGRKTQTIRKYRKYAIKKGETLYLYTGLRQRNSCKIGEGICTEIQDVYISEFPAVIFINDKIISQTEAEDLAKNDGFSDFAELYEWFEATHGMPFYGQLIKWELKTK